MDTDGFAIRSLVFADGRLVGYSFWANGWFPYFVPAEGRITWSERGLETHGREMEGLAKYYWFLPSPQIWRIAGMLCSVLMVASLVRPFIKRVRSRKQNVQLLSEA